MKLSRILLLVATLGLSASALAQYQWLDHNGRRVFSDRPPPVDIDQKNIISQPGTGMAPAPTAVADNTNAETQQAPAGVDPDLQQELNQQQQQAADTEAAEQKAQEQRQAAARADNCRRARSAVVTLESGRRIAQMNERGEREILSDAQREADLARARDMVRDNCN